MDAWLPRDDTDDLEKIEPPLSQPQNAELRPQEGGSAQRGADEWAGRLWTGPRGRLLTAHGACGSPAGASLPAPLSALLLCSRAPWSTRSASKHAQGLGCEVSGLRAGVRGPAVSPSSPVTPDHVLQLRWRPTCAPSPFKCSLELMGLWGGSHSTNTIASAGRLEFLGARGVRPPGCTGGGHSCSGIGLLRMDVGSFHEAAPSSQPRVLAGAPTSGDNMPRRLPTFWQRGPRRTGASTLPGGWPATQG